MYPFFTNNSAFNILPPAAPLIVLCDKATHFQPKTESSLMRPTLIPIPLYKSLSSFVCGRSDSLTYVKNDLGAEGKFNLSKGFLKFFKALTSCALETFFPNFILIVAI